MSEAVVIVGAGQAGLSTAYYLHRLGVDPLLIDSAAGPGGSWPHTWDSLRLFSPRDYSSLSGWPMPPTAEEYPTRDEVVAYFEQYERRYGLRIHRPTMVSDVSSSDGGFQLRTSNGILSARAVVSATGTYNGAWVPDVPGRDGFPGKQLHSAQYRDFRAEFARLQRRLAHIDDDNAIVALDHDGVGQVPAHRQARRQPRQHTRFREPEGTILKENRHDA